VSSVPKPCGDQGLQDDLGAAVIGALCVVVVAQHRLLRRRAGRERSGIRQHRGDDADQPIVVEAPHGFADHRELVRQRALDEVVHPCVKDRGGRGIVIGSIECRRGGKRPCGQQRARGRQPGCIRR